MTLQKVAVLGSNGQLGFELQQTVADGVELLPFDRSMIDLHGLTQEILSSVLPNDIDLIINAAAYTAVDKAESESEVAYAINADAVGVLAQFAQSRGIKLIHISTDFVFDGESSTPYSIDDPINPQSVYGASKAKGEALLFEHCPDAICIRTSWVYSTHGNNFVKTMIRLMNERDELGVVSDQIGSPTYARDLAEFIWQIKELDTKGIMHFSNEGIASWYDFASAIYLLGKAQGLIDSDCTIKPIKTIDYPTPAKRPAFSLLDKRYSDLERSVPHWLSSLSSMLAFTNQ
ncbi:MAG: dTDP-4-dehydrorhamnose reductase [Cellvibrionales bacterium]|nr:dTDP-4-dehydrorhamnose reductase [Cellvibrionales bacterium]